MFTWISNTRLWPLKANAMMPRAFKMLETFPISDFVHTGSYDTPCGLVLETDRTHVSVQYVTAVTAPTREIPAMEFRLGSWAKMSAEHTKTRYHSTSERELVLQVVLQTVWKKILNVLPPIIIRLTQVPPAKYRVGNRASIFPHLSPTENSTRFPLNTKYRSVLPSLLEYL